MRITFVLMVLFISSQTFAMDGNRQGFVLGFGIGGHTIDVNNNVDYSGLATSFKIGGGFNQNFLLYYVRDASWYSVNSGTTFVSGITGVGGSFYLSANAPSVYILGGIGIGDLAAPFETNVSSSTGDAVLFGLGFEFSPHVSIEGKILNTDIDGLETSSLLVTFNYLLY